MNKKLIIILLTLPFAYTFCDITIKDVIDEYPPEYCHLLEAAYGDSLMSEGGEEAIDHLFDGIDLANKKALDIGCGLGGAAFHLTKKHDMHVTGLEINEWMVQEATRRTPTKQREKLAFVLNQDNAHLPFDDASFDIVYSKGVLTHVQYKDDLFKECHRILKPGGLLVTIDWLSPVKNSWGPLIQKLAEVEGLSMYAETKDGYLETLTNAGFIQLDMQDQSLKYAKYNDDIVDRLLLPEIKEAFINTFGQTLYTDSVEGYGDIAEAQRTGELLAVRFVATKPIKSETNL